MGEKDKSKVEENKIDQSELKWVTISSYKPMTFPEKVKSKVSENPFVFVGCAATLTALSFGLISFYKKDGKRQQKMMRMRVAAQGFTLAALTIGLFLSATFKQNSKT